MIIITFLEMQIERSKNIVNAKIDANGNVIVGDGNIIINLKEAAEYKHLKRTLDELDEQLKVVQSKASEYPNDEYFKTELRRISKEQNAVKDNIEFLKKEVLKLAEEFSKISINTNRLRIAKFHFESGDFEKARAILDAEQLTTELEYLLEKKNSLEISLAENNENLKNKSNEFLILAALTSMDFDLPDRFDLTVSYFEKSIEAEKNPLNTFDYARFLQAHKNLNKALPLYQEAVKLSKNTADRPYNLETAAFALNNLSILYMDLNEFKKAQIAVEEAIGIKEKELDDSIERKASLASSYSNLAKVYAVLNKLSVAHELIEKSIKIYQQLRSEDAHLFTYELVLLLQNSATLYKTEKKLEKAKSIFQQALDIVNSSVEQEPNKFLPLLAHIGFNLAEVLHTENNHQEAKKTCQRSLDIFLLLANENPYTYSSDVASSSNLLADINSAEQNFEVAKSLYVKSLSIYRTLVNENPNAHSHDVAHTLNNLGTLLLENYKNAEAKLLFLEALEIYRELAKENPEIYLSEVSTALNNLAILFKRENNIVEAKKFYDESLSIVRKLAKENPDIFLPKLALTLNSIANLSLINKSIINNAENLYEEAFEIRRNLSRSNPDVFLPKLAITASNFSLYYLTVKADINKSLELAKDSLKYSLPFVERVPELSGYISNACQVITACGQDPQVIIRKILLEISNPSK